ncbi:MAG: nickel pincer cofactor biosynthesis protein LarC [Dysgonamonadaceae bacterium]|jgi:uncharacterized protein (TIGR00299 family) protein|nr:nickel pincer cofactor biosynthesis protein LarC [Dysgonamonadaceae bacterium]
MILYFDCFSGISGDMTLAALLDLGINKEQLTGELKKLGLEGWEIELTSVSKSAMEAKHVEVIVKESNHDHCHKHSHEHGSHLHIHRTMADIVNLIDESDISPNAKVLSKRIFMRLAEAEAKIHGTTPDKVHFHEVGAIDSIIDIVGTAICIDILSPDKIYASVLHDGYGFVECQHGIIPVPVPAVTEILAKRGVQFKQLDVEGEMMTPTGAAIIAELAESFGPAPEMIVKKIGYGAGKKNFPIPNILRIVEGERQLASYLDTVTIIETNIDDTTPEIMGYVMEKLFEAGAKDVFFTPIYMKKCRPATMLSVLCEAAKESVMEHILFTETSTIGLRKYKVERNCLQRKITVVSTPYGQVKAKEVVYGETSRINIEYEDACRLAKEKNIPLQKIYSQSLLSPFFNPQHSKNLAEKSDEK